MASDHSGDHTGEPSDDRDRPSPTWVLPPEPAIHRAARHGDLVALAQLLDAGADINQRGDLEIDNGPHLRGLTPLMVAARSIDGATVETLRVLVARGAELGALSEGEDSAAWYAAGDGGRWPFHRRATTPDHVERLRYLLDQGLDPSETNFVGRSLLTEAARAGDPDRVRLLLERGACACPENPAASARSDGAPPQFAVPRTAECRTLWRFASPIHCAAESGSAECVRVLLAAGADANERDEGGRTPLHGAGSVEVVEALISAGADLTAADQFGADPLETILEGGCCGGGCGPHRFDVARALLRAGAEIERLDSFGKTRLASAAFGHHADAVEFLLAHGADVHATDSSGTGALHSIAWQGEYASEETSECCRRIIEALAAAGADPNLRTNSGETPLHEAVTGDWGSVTAVRTLLACGADPDPRDASGRTPLHEAARGVELACVEALVEAGADPNVTDDEDQSPRDVGQAAVVECEGDVAAGPTDFSTLGLDTGTLALPTDDEQRKRLQARLEDARAIAALLSRARRGGSRDR